MKRNDQVTLVEDRLLSNIERILYAAATNFGENAFSAEALVVVCWNAFPKAFGLGSYAETHPDSNSVYARVMGASGLVGRGWFEQVRSKTYRVTPQGLAVAESLAKASTETRVAG